MKSSEMRRDLLFMRNEFPQIGKYGFSAVRKENMISGTIDLIAYSNIKKNDNAENKSKGVHFFVDDYRFERIYDYPYKSFDKLSQYEFLLGLDCSTYADMPIWRQIESIAHSRWVAAYWQSKGLIVYPTISWSTPSSYEFCFDGIEQGSTVAVGMVGSKRYNKMGFLRGYNEMLERIKPEHIICYGTPFKEMDGDIICVDYWKSRKVVR